MIIDIHGHILDIAYRRKKPLNSSLGGLTDVPLMRVGGVTGQLCAIWTPNIMLSGPHSHSVEAPLRTILEVLDYVHRELCGPAGADVLLVRSIGDLQTAESKGCVALIIGMEGTDALGGDPRVLQNLPRARRTSEEHVLKAFHDRPLLARRAGEIRENSVLTCTLVISTTTSSSLEDIVLPVYDEGFR